MFARNVNDGSGLFTFTALIGVDGDCSIGFAYIFPCMEQSGLWWSTFQRNHCISFLKFSKSFILASFSDKVIQQFARLVR